MNEKTLFKHVLAIAVLLALAFCLGSYVQNISVKDRGITHFYLYVISSLSFLGALGATFALAVKALDD
jgi:hypothetical protein